MYKIRYTDKWTGETRIHHYSGSEYDGRQWMTGLARDHGSKAELFYDSNPLSHFPDRRDVVDGPDVRFIAAENGERRR